MHHGAMKSLRCIALAAMLCIWALVGTASAVTYDLQAQTFTKTMPDGQMVTMWGYYNPALPGTVADQFPLVLEVPSDDDTLTINLTNNLPEFTSLQLSGFVDAGRTPTFFTDSQGQPRVKSFTNEATALGGSDNTASYTWTVDRPGTFLLQSGSHVAVQVPMGLYAVVKKNFSDANGQAYEVPAITFDNDDVVLLFSEIDPNLNAAVATGTLPAYLAGPPYTPRYFLVNGDPFPFGDTHTWVGEVNESVLVRLANAGLVTRAPTVVGGHWRLVAEDGFPYQNEKFQFSLDLTPGKTLDILGASPAQGYFPIYDRTLGLTNADTSTGGMFTYLEVGPHDTQVNLTVAKEGSGTVQSASLPGGIICDPLCTEHYLPDTELRLTAIADPGSVFAGWTGCTPIAGLNDCLLTLTTDATVTASFAQMLFRVGVFRAGQWYVDKGTPGWQDSDGIYPAFGAATDLPVSGDMNGDGFTEVGVYRPGTGEWFFDLDNSGTWGGCTTDNPAGTDLCLTQFGASTDIPVTGDWNGDGRFEVGVYRQGKWYFDMDGSGTWNQDKDAYKLNFGAPSDIPVTGDWNGDGKSDIGTYRQGTWFVDLNGNGLWDDIGGGDMTYVFGAPSDIPVTGDWIDDGDGKTEIGTYRQGMWFLDNGNGQWDTGDQTILDFGAPTDKPVTGFWR